MKISTRLSTVLSMSIIACVPGIFAQPPAANFLTLSGPGILKPGTSADLIISSSGTVTDTVAFQFQINLPTGVIISSVKLSPSAQAAGKQIFWDPGTRFGIIWAMNSSPVPLGQLVIVTVSIPATARGSSVLLMSDVIVSTGIGTSSGYNPGIGYAFNLGDLRDVNGDGKIDSLDVTGMISQSVPGAVCLNDVTKDGVCNVLDVMSIVLKVLGIVQ